MANNIITNHTLEQYNKKYRNLRYRLLKITKKEVEDFDKKNPAKTKGYLLKDRKWWLIGDAYYEIPKAPRFIWFRNLNAGVQTAVCLLGAGVIATAVTVPLVLLNQNKSSEHIAVIDPEIKDVTCTQKKLDNGALEITLKYDTSTKELDTLDIYMGNEKLVLNTDYTLEGNTIVIAADVLNKNKTYEIKIKLVLKDKESVIPIDLNFIDEDECYQYDTAEKIDSGSKFRATINYVDTRSIEFFYFIPNDASSSYYTIGINDPTKQINFISIYNSEGKDITSSASVYEDCMLLLEPVVNEKFVVNFTITESIDNLTIIAGDAV